MPKPPDSKSKTNNLTLIGKSEWSDKIQWFRKWCIINDVQISDVLYEKVEETARNHHYPSFQSQATLDHAENPSLLPRWQTCIHSNREMSGGEFLCKVDGWQKLPQACDRCNRYLQVKEACQ